MIYNNYPISDIKTDYFLRELCVGETSQLENIAITIQSLYFYHDILVSSNLPKTIEASLCRTIIIMSYSVIEAIVISLGYKLQNSCISCKKKCVCRYYSISMFSNINEKVNEKKSFINANDFLSQIGIIYLLSSDKKFYDEYRNSRNNVHLGRNAEIITKDLYYSKTNCEKTIRFMQEFIRMLNDNFSDFIKNNKCKIV